MSEIHNREEKKMKSVKEQSMMHKSTWTTLKNDTPAAPSHASGQ